MRSPHAHAELQKVDVSKAKAAPGVTFLGRLGTYRYLDMDVAIAEALKVGRGALTAMKGGAAPASLYSGEAA